MDNIVVFGEKPSQTKACAPYLAKAFPSSSFHVVSSGLRGPVTYRIPRGITFADLPASVPLEWVPRRDYMQYDMKIAPDASVARCAGTIDYADLLSRADRIVFAADPDAIACRNFVAFLSAFLKEEHRPKVGDAYRLVALDDASLTKTFATPLNFFIDGFMQQADAGCTKSYFDANYAVNAFPLFGKALAECGIPCEPLPLSKFGLQLLYWMRDMRPVQEPAPMSEGRIIGVMQSWRGSGKYSGMKARLGSEASAADILGNLLKANLLIKNGETIDISSLGVALLDRLHPDCCDPDLPFRLQKWSESGLEKSKSSIDRYIRTFFGKQKRFSRLSPLHPKFS